VEVLPHCMRHHEVSGESKLAAGDAQSRIKQRAERSEESEELSYLGRCRVERR
jgi:hypothetical protein